MKTSFDPVIIAYAFAIASDILLHSNKTEKLAPIHVVSVLDSLIKIESIMDKYGNETTSNKNWKILESIMGRSLSFFE